MTALLCLTGVLSFPEFCTNEVIQHVDVHVYLLKWHNVFEIHIDLVTSLSFLHGRVDLIMEKLLCVSSTDGKLLRTFSKASIPFCIMPTVHRIASRSTSLEMLVFVSQDLWKYYVTASLIFWRETQHNFDPQSFVAWFCCGKIKIHLF